MFIFLFLRFTVLADGEGALAAQLAVLVHHAVNPAFLHRLRVVNMLRLKRALLHK